MIKMGLEVAIQRCMRDIHLLEMGEMTTIVIPGMANLSAIFQITTTTFVGLLNLSLAKRLLSPHMMTPVSSMSSQLRLIIGTRSALYANGRESISVTIEEVTPRSVGAIIALYERAVGLYASLVNINAYHQPGVEAGKKAAAEVLALQKRVLSVLNEASCKDPVEPLTLDEIADRCHAPEEIEMIYKIIAHMSANDRVLIAEGSCGSPRSVKVYLGECNVDDMVHQSITCLDLNTFLDVLPLILSINKLNKEKYLCRLRLKSSTVDDAVIMQSGSDEEGRVFFLDSHEDDLIVEIFESNGKEFGRALVPLAKVTEVSAYSLSWESVFREPGHQLVGKIQIHFDYSASSDDNSHLKTERLPLLLLIVTR
ncbi:hypothetical protein F2Q68_00037397 [Brassica cretica]|uniref:glucose-6-phosphate isomerase n=1 Tax=Brassica cretica TaxID=69181 RepID=A0A8S9H870_BRACR|nr:hypothetical protein F2Q68_00037397 [Brassica cretica]